MKNRGQKLLATGSTLLFVIFLSVQARAACSVPSFAAGNNLATGAQPLSISTGDFNSDGKLDLASANFRSNSVSIFLGNGTGGFVTPQTLIAGANPSSLVVVDLNGDGKQDLAVTNAGSDNISVFLGDGAGAFGTAKTFFVGANPSAVAVSDFNGDAKPDLSVANADTNNISVLLGDGAGSFGAATNFLVGYTPLALAIGDFNGDGFRDMAVANFFYDDNGDNISILLGNGGGGFTPGGTLYAGTFPTSIVGADFNVDGKLDLAVVNVASFDVSIFLGNGAGAFTDQAVFDVEESPSSIATGDFNGDSRLDLAVANGDSNNVSVLLGNGTGGFSAAANFGAGTNPSAVVTGNFNLDGSLDLAVANADSNNLSILLNNCAPPAPVLIADTTSGRLAALDSVTMLRDPFAVFTTLNFSMDQHTRIMLFAANVAPDESAASVLVQAQGLQSYSLPVEFIGKVPNYDWLTEIVVRLPDGLSNESSVQVSIHVRGVASNKVLMNIKQ